MASQFQWTYLDARGQLHRIGLYHGPRSGHVVVYCDGRILFVDFAVFHDKVYPFFIEDQLCELHLIREKNAMRYEFKVNTEADTPLNKARKEQMRQEHRWTQLRIGLGAVLILAWLASFIWILLPKRNPAAPLDATGPALIVRLDTTQTRIQAITYSWVAATQVHTHTIHDTDKRSLRYFFALPWQRGDELIVQYASVHPSKHHLRTDTLPPQTLNLLLTRMYERATTIPTCIWQAAWHSKRLEGLALLWQASKDQKAQPWQSVFRDDVHFQLAMQKFCLQ